MPPAGRVATTTRPASRSLPRQRFEKLPRDQVQDEGPDHAKRFFATVMIGGQPRGKGEGGSKKQAEQAAARAVWRWLSVQGTDQAGEAPGSGETPGNGETPGSDGSEGTATPDAARRTPGAAGEPGDGPPSDGNRAGSAMGGTNAGAT